MNDLYVKIMQFHETELISRKIHLQFRETAI